MACHLPMKPCFMQISDTMLDGENGPLTSMNVRDATSIAEGAALAGSWIWLCRRHLSFSGWRSKASVASLGCVSLAVLLDLMHISVLQFVGLERVACWVGFERFVSLTWGLFASMATLACLSLILAVLGKGQPPNSGRSVVLFPAHSEYINAVVIWFGLVQPLA
jgi:hypothetical protein